MRVISAEAFDLLSFFEVEPELSGDDPWPYVDALYRVVQGNLALTVAIHPAYRDIRVILKVGGQTVYELNAMGVRDVRYGKDEGAVEILDIDISENNAITLQINPRIEIKQSAEVET